MKRFLLYAVLASTTLTLQALEFSAQAGLGNLAFDPGRETPLGSGQFSGSLHLIGRVQLEQILSELLCFRGTLERDPVLKTRIAGEAAITTTHFSIFTGPFFGFFNSTDYLVSPGVQGGLSLEYPGIVFASLRGGLAADAETGELSCGFWLPSVVSTFTIRTKCRTAGVTGESRRYQYSADIFDKSYPYTIRVHFGYEYLAQTYSSGKDVFKILFAGAQTTFSLQNQWSIRLGAEIPVYSWGKNPLTKDSGQFFFNVWAGASRSF
jgi:hypothetical protein